MVPWISGLFRSFRLLGFGFFLAWTGASVHGQEAREEGTEEPLETDRDSFTPATKTVGSGRWILESAYSFLDNRGVKETHSFPELLVRYGLTERLELRLGWNYEVGGAGNEVSGVDVGGDDFASQGTLVRESRFLYGFKYQVSEQQGWRPQSAVTLQGFSPTTGRANDSSFLGTYVFGWVLPNRWKLDGSFRYGTASEDHDHFHTWAPSVVLKKGLGSKVNLHAEYFSVFSSGKDQDFALHYFSPGAHYLITPNLEVGVRLGWGLNDQSARFFTNVGFGWRF